MFHVVLSYSVQREMLADSGSAMAGNLARLAERTIEQQLDGLERLARTPYLQAGDYGAFAPVAQHYLSIAAPNSHFMVLDRAGTVLFAAGMSIDPEAHAPISRRVFETGEPQVGLVANGPPRFWHIGLEAPVRRQGEVIATISMDFPLLALQSLLNGQHLPAHWSAMIIDPFGRIVARRPERPDAPGSSLSAEGLATLAAAAVTGTFTTGIESGPAAFVAAARTPRFGWYTAVSVPAEVVNAPLRHSLVKLLGVGLAALCTSWLLAMFVARRLSRPITALATMAIAFEDSDGVPAAPPPSLREADDVARVLQSALRRRRAAEDSALEAETRASRLLEAAPCGVILFAPDGSWSYVNRGTCELLARSAEELTQGVTVESPDFDIRDADGITIPVEQRASSRALRGETVRDFEVSMLRGDGRRIPLLLSSVPLRDRSGRITGALTAMLDISETRAARERVEKLLQTLEIRVEEEVAARHAAQIAAAQAQKMQALGQLAGGIAHDFNNVLQTITGAVSLIESRAEDPVEVLRFAHAAASAADRGASIAGRLLAFARRSDLTPAPVEVSLLLSETHEILAHTLSSGIEVRTECAPDAGWLLADRAQLETALVNLATNARDAMPDGGTLILRARAERVSRIGPHPAGLSAGDYVRLDVIDTGMGMDAATLARATDPFFTTKPIDRGTGLGLSMVRGLVEQLAGGIEIVSAPGEGTTVSVWLPATVGPPSRVAEEQPPPPAAPPPCHGSLRVLVVDDEPDIRAVLVEGLGERGWKVEQAGCAQEAIELLREASFDVLVSDQSMPGESGMALISMARRLRPGLPAILLTGLAPELGADFANSRGADGPTEVAGKPMRARDLARRIEGLLARGGRKAA